MLHLFGKLFEKVSEYTDVKIRLFKLSMVERTAKVMGFFMFMLITLLVGLAAFTFLGIGIAKYFAQVTGSEPWGYVITTGIFIVAAFIMHIFKRPFIKLLAGLFVNILTDDDEDEEEDDIVENP